MYRREEKREVEEEGGREREMKSSSAQNVSIW